MTDDDNYNIINDYLAGSTTLKTSHTTLLR